MNAPLYDMGDVSDLHAICPRCQRPTTDGNCVPCDLADIEEARRAQAEMDRFGSGPAGLKRWQAHIRRQQRG